MRGWDSAALGLALALAINAGADAREPRLQIQVYADADGELEKRLITAAEKAFAASPGYELGPGDAAVSMVVDIEEARTTSRGVDVKFRYSNGRSTFGRRKASCPAHDLPACGRQAVDGADRYRVSIDRYRR